MRNSAPPGKTLRPYGRHRAARPPLERMPSIYKRPQMSKAEADAKRAKETKEGRAARKEQAKKAGKLWARRKPPFRSQKPFQTANEKPPTRNAAPKTGTLRPITLIRLGRFSRAGSAA